MNEFNNPYHFIRDNYFGNGGYNYSNSYSYLKQHPRETKEFYQDRKETTPLENLFQPLQDLFLDPIISNQVDFSTQNLILDNIIKQTKLFYHSTTSLLDFKLYGKCIFSVTTDFFENGEPDINILPEINTVFAGDVINLNMNGLLIKDAIYKEYEMIDFIKIPIKVEYSNNYFSRLTLAWRDEKGNITLKDMGEENRIKDFDGYKYGVLSKIGLKLDEIPKSFNLAQIQKLLYNLDTQRLDTLRKNGFPILMIQTNENITNLSLSNDTVIRVPAHEEIKNLPEYLEAQLEGVTLTTEIMQEKKSTIYKVFTNGLFSDNIKYTSTMSSLIATNSFTSAVNNLYLVYQEINKIMIENILFIYNLETNYTINYKPINLTDDEIQTQAEEILE